MFVVRCRNAAGTARELKIRASNGNTAARLAVAECERDYPAQGWRAEIVL